MTTLLAMLALALGDDAEALEKFKADIKGKDGTARAAAVEELAKTKSLKICTKLASLLTGEVTEVRIAAAKGLSEQDDKKHAVAYLVAGVPPNAKDPVILAPILTAIGKVGQEQGAAEVNKYISAEEVEVAKAAVEAAGEIKSGSSFDPLIKELKNCEEILKPRDKNNPGGGFGGRLGAGPGRLGNNGQNFREMRERAQTLKAEIQKVLVSMAKVNCQDAQDWENWWKEHRGSYKVEKP
ncbi:MAG TPA: HEAT repeat domain-containing protein [Planctomycetota bacterium]|jgi:HEAT repeat protein|nr:HEAT repeat domain-containing protein [Planctomycetota bacterium]